LIKQKTFFVEMLSQVMSRHSKVTICLGLVVIVVLAIREPGSMKKDETRSVLEELTSTLGGSEEIAFGQSLFQVM
jgi:Na+/H+ antiporter NhaC